jgi:hypothetical protein
MSAFMRTTKRRVLVRVALRPSPRVVVLVVLVVLARHARTKTHAK